MLFLVAFLPYAPTMFTALKQPSNFNFIFNQNKCGVALFLQ